MSGANVKGGEVKIDPKHIDAFAMARNGTSASGEMAIVRFARFMEGLPEQSAGEAGLLKWHVAGEIGKGTGKTGGIISGQPLLRLHITASPAVICQRCNAPFVYPVDSTVVLQLVESEDDLDDELADLESAQEEGLDFAAEVPEKVLGSHRFDLLAQIEDELILSVPYIPRHEVCPGHAQSVNSDEASQPAEFKRPSPFAVLEQLKRKN